MEIHLRVPAGRIVMDVEGTSELSDLSVLLFHEDRRQLKYYQSALRLCGLQNVFATDTTTEALRRIILGGFDMVFMTYPEETSVTASLLEEIISMDAIRGVPLIVIMPEENVSSAMSVMARGVSEILVGPLSRHALEKLVSKVMSSRYGVDPRIERLEVAKTHLKRGDLDRAGAIFHEFLQQDCFEVDAHIGLFEILCTREKWLDAENHLRKALEIAKESHDKIDVWRRLATIFYHYGAFYEKRQYPEKAAKSYRTSISLDPFSVESTKALLRLLQKKHEINEMIDVIRKAQALLLPNSPSMGELALCVRELARRFADLKMGVPARRLYEQLLTIVHSHVEIHLEVVEFCLGLGQVSLVLKTLIEVSERVRDPRLFCRIGTLLLDNEKRYMGSGRLDTTGSSDLSFFRGLDAGQVLSMAQQAFQDALLLDGSNPRTALSLARCHLRRRQHALAAEMLDVLQEMHGADADFLAEAIQYLLAERAYDFALSWLKEAMVQFPHDARFCRLYAECCMRQGRENDAVGWLRRGLALEPENSALIVALAELHRDLGQYPDAVLYYQKAGKLLPDNALVRDGLRESTARMHRSGRR